jgi:hypothetical protein
MPETADFKSASQTDALDSLYRDAEELASQVNARLTARETTERLVPKLRELNIVVQNFHEKLNALVPLIDSLSPADRDVLRSLQRSFPELMHLVDSNHRLAASSGLPVTGVGGKPYRPQPQRAQTTHSPVVD